MSKVYLSLDDLHTLYGISPAVLHAIKKKRKKRKNKKNKINNGTMGKKPSDSSHMVGYSSALEVAAKQLQQTNINKHILAINDNNEKVRIEQEPDNLHPNDPNVRFFNNIKEGVNSGKLKVSQTQTGFTVTDKTLRKAKLKKSDRVEEVMETPGKKQTGLSNNTSRNMNRDYDINVMGDFLFDGIAGSLSKGASSEKFVSEDDIPALDPNINTIELDAAAAVDSSLDVGALEFEPEPEPEADLIDTNAKPSYIPKNPVDKYSLKELQGIAKKYKVSIKGISKKQDIYDILIINKLV